MNKFNDYVGQLPPADAPIPSKPPKTVQIDEATGRILDMEGGGAGKVVNFTELLHTNHAELEALIAEFDANPFVLGDAAWQRRFRNAYAQHGQIITRLLGYLPNLERVELPTNHEQLSPATDAVFDALAELQQYTPSALYGINVPQLRFLRNWLEHLRKLAEEATSFQHALAVLVSLTAQSLDGQLRQIWRRSGETVRANFDLNRRLYPLRQLISGPAAQGVETRASLAKARKEAVGNYVEANKEAPRAPEPTPPRPTPPDMSKDKK